MSKCTRCENDTFKTMEYENIPSLVFVQCRECDTIVGTMEDINFSKWRSDMFKNHNFFEKRFNDLEEEIKDNQKKQREIIDLLENVLIKLSR